MKLVFIYGPPAAGKLTVGRELARTTGYRLFHNHLTVDVARVLFPGHHEPHPPALYSALLKRLRLDVLEIAAHAGANTIFTLAYSGTVDDPFVAQIVEKVETHGGAVKFVQLVAPDETLLRRVSNGSRTQLGKIADPTALRQVLATRTMHEQVKYPGVLRLDTTQLTPQAAAKQIIAHFTLA